MARAKKGERWMAPYFGNSVTAPPIMPGEDLEVEGKPAVNAESTPPVTADITPAVTPVGTPPVTTRATTRRTARGNPLVTPPPTPAVNPEANAGATSESTALVSQITGEDPGAPLATPTEVSDTRTESGVTVTARLTPEVTPLVTAGVTAFTTPAVTPLSTPLVTPVVTPLATLGVTAGVNPEASEGLPTEARTGILGTTSEVTESPSIMPATSIFDLDPYEIWSVIRGPATNSSSYRYEGPEFEMAREVIREIEDQHGKILKNSDLIRLGLVVVARDWKERGEGSLLAFLVRQRRRQKSGDF
jgi:hypothetical protein